MSYKFRKQTRFKPFRTVQGKVTGGLNKMGFVNSEEQQVTTAIRHKGELYIVKWDYDVDSELKAGKYGSMMQRMQVKPPTVYKRVGLREIRVAPVDVPAGVVRQIQVKEQKAKAHSMKAAKEEQKALARGAKSAAKTTSFITRTAERWARIVKGVPKKREKDDG